MAKRIIDLIGRGSIARTEAPVTFDKTFNLFRSVASRGIHPELPEAATTTKASDPKTWWKGNSTRGLFAPIGQKGAGTRDPSVRLRRLLRCILVGRQGSGKSTLLHTYVGGLTTLYGPDELEFTSSTSRRASSSRRTPRKVSRTPGWLPSNLTVNSA